MTEDHKPKPGAAVIRAIRKRASHADTDAADLLAMLNEAGIEAEIATPGRVEEVVRRQAEQLLKRARECESAEERAEMEQLAHAALAELKSPQELTCRQCGTKMQLAQTVPAVAGHAELRTYRCGSCGAVTTTADGLPVLG
jgi:hypothetical protein